MDLRLSRTVALAVAGLLLTGTALPLQAQKKKALPNKAVRTFGGQEKDPLFNTHHFAFSPEVVADPDGTIRLARSVLIADEKGATDHHQSETLGDQTWAKKVLVLDSAELQAAELFFFGSARQVRVNGRPVVGVKPLESTGWSRVKVPIGFWKAGDNEVVFAGEGQLTFEPGHGRGRSFKSGDGGQSWSDRLGKGEGQTGEYLVRLRVGKHPRSGWAMSDVFDLWAERPGIVATPSRVTGFHHLGKLKEGQPPGTRLVPWLRTGSSPTPDPKTWTGWKTLESQSKPEGPAARHRWAQLKFDFTTARPQATPRLPRRFEFSFDLQPDPTAANEPIKVDRPAGGAVETGVPSIPFAYQQPSPRLQLLRERYLLDKVIAPGQNEVEQLMLLRHWVRNQWHTAWGSHPAAWMPPWDALVILESKDQPDCLTMCTHYAAVFTQCCLALGWNARHCILDHHCVSEVWVEQHRKWVMMDAGNSSERADVGLHFEKDGVPLSALELHRAHAGQKTDGILVCFTPAKLAAKIAPLCRPAPPATKKTGDRPDTVSVADLPKYPVCGLENFRRFAFPARNNYLTSLYPGELYQGWSQYAYDGYCWVGDSRDEPKTAPEYSLHLPPARPQDIDWGLNWVRVHLAKTVKPGELQVDLETRTPNFARFERMGDDAKWQPAPADFVWKLNPGKNELRVRSANRFDRAGGETRMAVKWDRPAKTQGATRQ